MLRNSLPRAKIFPSSTTANETFVCLFRKKTSQLSLLRPLTTTASCLKKTAGVGSSKSGPSDAPLDELRKGIKDIISRPAVEGSEKKGKRSEKKEKEKKEKGKKGKIPSGAKPKKKQVLESSRRTQSLSIKGVSLATALAEGSSKRWSDLLPPGKRPNGLSILDPDLETLEPITKESHENPPHIHHDLDRVLFNPGVHYLQDPRSRVYNFDPYLRDIMPVTEFNFGAVDSYITSSEDKDLETIAKSYSKKYVGSTSSMTAVLSHFHFLLSHWRGINTGHLSKSFPVEYQTFTQISRAPVAVFLRYKGDGTYAIDPDKEFDTESVLSLLGRSLEKMLTLPPHEYEALHKSKAGKEETTIQHPDSFHYSTLGDFLMRSQLDAYDPRLPGTGIFDLKTRAVVSVRMDVSNFHLGSGYQIKTLKGQWESFEREYFDMIRAAFLKYSLQVRMGRMDGIFVAFHNTDRIFGFQYISLDEMDSTIHECWGSGIGDREFKASLMLMNKILDRATQKFPEQSIRFHFETRETQTPQMYIIAEPVTESQIDKIQRRNERDMSEFLKSLEKKWSSIGKRARLEEPEIEEEVTEVESEVGSSIEEVQVETEMTEVYEQGQQGLGGSLETESADANNEGVEAAGSVLDADEEDEENKDEKEAELDEEKEEELDEEKEEELDEEEVLDEEKEEELGGEKEEELDEEKEEELDEEKELDEVETPLAEGDLDPTKPKKNSAPERNILAMTLTTYNIVNDAAILRPRFLRPKDQWVIEYTITEAKTNERAWNTYTSIKTRRKKAVEHRLLAEDNDQVSQYVKYLRTLSKVGRTWAAEQEKQFQNEVPVVYKAGGAHEGSKKGELDV